MRSRAMCSPFAVTNIDLCFKLSTFAVLHRSILEHIKYLLKYSKGKLIFLRANELSCLPGMSGRGWRWGAFVFPSHCKTNMAASNKECSMKISLLSTALVRRQDK